MDASGLVLALCLLCGLVFLLVLASVLTFTGYLHYVHWKHSHIPQPNRPSFYLGHIPDLLQLQKETGNLEISLTPLILQWSEQVRSPVFVINLLYRTIVITTDAENVKAIIMHPKHGKDPAMLKYMEYLMGERFLGRGLFTIPDFETWRPRRQLYDPGFKKSYLRTLLEPLNELVDRLVEKLKALADGTTSIPMRLQFGEFTLNVISKITFGSDFTQQFSEIERDHNILKEDFVVVVFKGLGLCLRFPGYQYFHPFKAAEYRRMCRSIRAIGRDCIKNRIQMIHNCEVLPNDILTLILQIAATEKSVEIEELVDDFVTFFTAGQEITASMLTFALVLTLQHPNVLERVLSEVDSVLGTKTNVEYEDLQKLEYTEQVLKETMRLYPALEGVSKMVAPGGVTLSGHFIPGGTNIMLCSSAMCRMSKYFDHPESFNPSRFDGKIKQPSSFVYFPFGLGHRSCLGKQFAMIMSKIAFSRVFQNFKFTLPEGYELIAAQRGTIQTKDNVHCTLEIRHPE